MKIIEDTIKEQRDALKFVLEEVNPNDPKVHITVRDLRQIDKLCKVIEGSAGSLSFEDNDFKFLLDKFNNYSGWNPQARELILSIANKLESVA